MSWQEIVSLLRKLDILKIRRFGLHGIGFVMLATVHSCCSNYLCQSFKYGIWSFHYSFLRASFQWKGANLDKYEG